MCKTGAAGTLDAPLPIQVNQLTQRDMLGKMFFIRIFKAAFPRTKTHGQVLERAFAAFIADRAIQRVGCKEKFQHIPLG